MTIDRGFNPIIERADGKGGSSLPNIKLALGHVSKRKAPKSAGTHSFDEGPESLGDPEQHGQWISDRLGFKNEAKNPEVSARAKQVIRNELGATKTTLEYLRNKWLILYRLYRGESLSRFFYRQSNFHAPEPYKAVETIVPRIMAALFENEPWFKFIGEKMSDDMAAKMMEAYVSHQAREVDFVRRFEPIIRDICIYGSKPLYVHWKQEFREVNYRRPRRMPNPRLPGSSMIQLEEVSQEEFVADTNEFSPLDIYDFYGPPLASDVQVAEWCGHRTLYTVDKMKSQIKSGMWDNADELADLSGQDSANFDDEFKQRRSYSIGVWTPSAELQSNYVGHYEVFERWGLFDIDGTNDPVPCQIVAIQPRGRCVIVRVSKNPYWHGRKPYVLPRYTRLDNELFGIGVIEPIAKLSLELDEKRQLELAAQNLSSNPALIVGDGANVPDEQLVIQPGLVLRAGSTDDIKPLIIPDVSDAAIKGAERIKQDIRETTGASTTMQGGSDAASGSETATAVSRKLDEGSVRIRGTITNIEIDGIVPLLDMWIWNNQQFTSVPMVIREIGSTGLKWPTEMVVRPESITGKFRVMALAGFRLNQHRVMTQQLVNLLDRAPVINQLQPGLIRIDELLFRVLRDGFGFKDASDIINMDTERMGLPSALEEEELWMHGEVPPVRKGENLVRHIQSHSMWLRGEKAKWLLERAPDIYAKVVAHVQDTMREMAKLQEQQEAAMMVAMQQQALAGPTQGGEAGGRGFAEPGQAPGSPKFRGPAKGDEVQSEATQQAPNEGAQ